MAGGGVQGGGARNGAYGRMGETTQGPGNGRAKNSARPRLGSFATPIRAGFELRRDVIPPKKTERLSILNEGP
jgi:hypothetical protein